MKKILMGVLIFFLCLIIFFMLTGRLSFGRNKILGIEDIKQESDKLDNKIEEVSKLTSITYNKKTDELKSAQKTMLQSKQSYEEKLVFSTESEIANANRLENYNIEFLWTRIGKYATSQGLTLKLEGDSNDYFGKGLSGGKLVVYPSKEATYKQDENIIIGNVALYGATSGKAFINGVAGERFAVRNSGATAVVEGCGDHGCEYMTGGRVVVLGTTGKNFAAGMSGGIAYVLDEDATLYKRLNKSMVSLETVTDKYDVLELKSIIAEHVAATGSVKGKEIYDNFSDYLPKFKRIVPFDYKLMMQTIVQMEEKGLSSEQAQIEAFNLLMGRR